MERLSRPLSRWWKRQVLKLAVEPDWKVIESIVLPPGNCVFQYLIEAETDGIPAGGSLVEPRAEVGGEESSDEDFNRIGHGVSFAGGGGLPPSEAKRARARRRSRLGVADPEGAWP
jgi:hypothetical protein